MGIDLPPMPTEIFILITTGVLAAGILIGYSVTKHFWKKERQAWDEWQEEQLAELQTFRKNYLTRKDVVVSDNQKTDFISVDGGKNWYQCEISEKKKVKLILDGKIAQPLLTQAISNQLAIERTVRNGLVL